MCSDILHLKYDGGGGGEYWGKYDDEDVDDHFVFAFDL